jgi:hypothetical protein
MIIWEYAFVKLNFAVSVYLLPNLFMVGITIAFIPTAS